MPLAVCSGEYGEAFLEMQSARHNVLESQHQREGEERGGKRERKKEKEKEREREKDVQDVRDMIGLCGY